jgi:hypothetical protein
VRYDFLLRLCQIGVLIRVAIVRELGRNRFRN